MPTPPPIEREVKLRFAGLAEARAAVAALGATPLRDRRLQEDCLLDTNSEQLRQRRSALRVRMEGGQSRVTFKGPAQPGPMKIREEHETLIGDGEVLLRIFAELGYRPWFRYQKYREEFSLPEVVIAIDETPVGVYVELEGSEAGIDHVAARLGRSRTDYVLSSYYGLFDEWRRLHKSAHTDMVFDQ